MDRLEKRFYYLLSLPGVAAPGQRIQQAKKFADEARQMLTPTRLVNWQRPRDSKGHFMKLTRGSDMAATDDKAKKSQSNPPRKEG